MTRFRTCSQQDPCQRSRTPGKGLGHPLIQSRSQTSAATITFPSWRETPPPPEHAHAPLLPFLNWLRASVLLQRWSLQVPQVPQRGTSPLTHTASTGHLTSWRIMMLWNIFQFRRTTTISKGLHPKTPSPSNQQHQQLQVYTDFKPENSFKPIFRLF